MENKSGLLIFLTMLHGFWDLSSLSKDKKPGPPAVEAWSLTTDSHKSVNSNVILIWLLT